MNDTYALWFAQHKKQILDDFFTFLSFESVSTDPSRKQTVRECAEWLSRKIYEYGYSSEIWETEGHPIIFASHLAGGPSKPTILLYLHYDVQPEDPLDEWITPPFTPTIREGKVYARGAIDNKGQCFYTLAALAAFKKLGNEQGINIKVLIEGEEEIGSPSLEAMLEEKRKVLKADYALVVDVDIPSLKQPSITLGCRGIATLNVQLKTAGTDLHSGSFGGIACNPNHILAKIVASFWNEDGSIAVEGFYDGIIPLSKEQQSELVKPAELEKDLEALGIHVRHREVGYDLTETGSLRPTIEVNGFHGGYAGSGSKTVIPAKGEIKLSCRLVPGQCGKKVLDALEKHIEKQIPKGAAVSFSHKRASDAFLSPFTSSFTQMLKEAYAQVLGVPCGVSVCGGSIPITEKLKTVASEGVACCGYGLPSDGMHAPNEHFGLDRFELGFLTMATLFDRVSHIC